MVRNAFVDASALDVHHRAREREGRNAHTENVRVEESTQCFVVDDHKVNAEISMHFEATKNHAFRLRKNWKYSQKTKIR